MIFFGTLVRMRLQRCRSELMQVEVASTPDIRQRLWATAFYESLHAAKHDFHCMQIQLQDPCRGPTKTVLDKASVLDPANAEARDVQSTCLCCLEDFEDSAVVALLPCGHIFHEACIMAWTVAKRRASRACPVCRANFMVL
ncbi:Rnf103 [Symbiodinium natans]|uniref:Rnf103 protein n=1 Tax=Symbiodinium natans TaxID=878477 RepID=A0A812NEG8_9DINO|nr:Rnf103 [Symbiodinium natans]